MSISHSRLAEALYDRSAARLSELKQQFPHQFPHHDAQYAWPTGWQHLVQRACEILHRHRPESRWVQIKEKFGGLRLYFQGGPMRADIRTDSGLISLPVWTENPPHETDCYALIAVIETESQSTCACCGGIGRLSNCSGYFITLCADCAQRHGAVFVRPQEK